MAEALRLCVFDSPGLETETTLRDVFKDYKNVFLVGEASTWDDLREWLRFGSVDIVAVNLDSADDQGLKIVRNVVELTPSCGIIGVSSRNDPQGIITAMRAGCSQFVSWPIDPADLRSAVERIRATRQNAVSASKRICVVGASGGAGATTIACNLAMELAQLTDRRAAIVDMNLEFGDVCCCFDCNPSYGVADVCREDIEIDRVLLDKALHELPCKVSILARPQRLEAAREVSPDGVGSMLKVLSGMFPYVVVDLPRMFSFLSAAAVHEADRILIVTQLGVPSIRNATRLYECLEQMGAREDTIDIVLNRCNANFERISPKEVESHFGRPIFAMVPNDYRQVQNAIDLGHPIVADAPASAARLAIREMARKIAADQVKEEEAAPPPSGFLKRFWKRGAKAEA